MPAGAFNKRIDHTAVLDPNVTTAGLAELPYPTWLAGQLPNRTIAPRVPLPPALYTLALRDPRPTLLSPAARHAASSSGRCVAKFAYRSDSPPDRRPPASSPRTRSW